MNSSLISSLSGPVALAVILLLISGLVCILVSPNLVRVVIGVEVLI
jgi:hypothetical protein